MEWNDPENYTSLRGNLKDILVKGLVGVTTFAGQVLLLGLLKDSGARSSRVPTQYGGGECNYKL